MPNTSFFPPGALLLTPRQGAPGPSSEAVHAHSKKARDLTPGRINL